MLIKQNLDNYVNKIKIFKKINQCSWLLKLWYIKHLCQNTLCMTLFYQIIYQQTHNKLWFDFQHIFYQINLTKNTTLN